MDTKSLIAAYYDAFNAGRTDDMLALLHDEIEHHVNEGGIRRGKALFADFNAHMSESYKETLTDMVIFANEDGSRAAAEFVVNGTYLKTDPGLPEAHGQSYRLINADAVEKVEEHIADALGRGASRRPRSPRRRRWKPENRASTEPGAVQTVFNTHGVLQLLQQQVGTRWFQATKPVAH